MPTQGEIEAAARVLCRTTFYQLPASERICSADQWADQPVNRHDRAAQPDPYRRWETFAHEARLALEAAEFVRPKESGSSQESRREPARRAG
jgi:hypothetical protein